MNQQRSFFYLLCCFAVLPWSRASAQDIKIQPCSFNGGRWIQTRYVPEARGFKLDWSDGPKMTYTLAKPDDTTQQVTDSLGGKWHYNKSTGNEGFSLSNPPAFRKDDTPLNRTPGGLMEQINASL
jgi:hypothetical protein